MNSTINFDRPKLAKLKREYAKAKEAGREQFTFDGSEFLVSYAKYLIEYLETQFSEDPTLN